MRILSPLLLTLLLALLGPSEYVFAKLKLVTFQRGGETFYAIRITHMPNIEHVPSLTEYMKTGKPWKDYRPPEGPVNFRETNSDLPTIMRILYEGHPLLEAEDLKTARSHKLFQWKPYKGDPTESYWALKDFQSNIQRLLAEYADYYKWKSYEETGTIPSVLDIPKLRAKSPLVSEGTVAILFLDSKKNFAGLVGIAYPTVTNPLLPAQELLNVLKENGIAPKELEVPMLNNYRAVQESSKETLAINQNYQLVMVEPLARWMSLSVELKSIVKNKNLALDIMPLSVLLLESMKGSDFIPLNQGGPWAVVNNGAPFDRSVDGFRVPNEGQFIGTSSARLFPLHKRMGWEELFRIEDLIYMRLSRENYFRAYLKSLDRSVGGSTMDDIRQSLIPERRYHFAGEDKAPKKMASELRVFGNRVRSCRSVFAL